MCFLPEDDPQRIEIIWSFNVYFYNYVLDFVHFVGYCIIHYRQEYFFTC